MNYTFWSTTSNTITDTEFSKLSDFVNQEIANSTEPAAANMGMDSTAGLLYNIKNQLRWNSDQGAIYVAEHSNQIVAVSCVEYPENTQAWAIGGIRIWITDQHRTQQLPSQFLDQQLIWARERGCNFMLLTFNDYNRGLHVAVARGLYRVTRGWSSWWDDCVAVEKQVRIRSTPQWCVIKPVCQTDSQINLAELQAWSRGQINI